MRSTRPKHLIVTIDLPGLVREYYIIGSFDIVKQETYFRELLSGFTLDGV